MRFMSTALICCLIALPAFPVYSETLLVRPSLDLNERYDSNVVNAPPGAESSDAVTRATPKLTTTLSIFSTKVSLVGGFDAEYFLRHTELNKFEMTRNFELSTGEPMQITPRFSLRPAARYIESRDSVRRNQLSQTTVPGLAPTETQVTARTGIREYSGFLNANFAISGNLDSAFGFGAARKSYFDGGPLLVGSNNYSANGSMSYKLTDTFSAGGYGTASYDEFDNKNDVRNFSGGVSAKYIFSASSSLDARAGMTWIRDDMGSRIKKPSGRLEYGFKSLDFMAALSASIDYAAGAFGTESKRESVTLRLSDRFSTNWSGDTSGVWQTNRSVRAPYLEDQMSVQWAAGAHYSVTEYARINLSGELFKQWNKGIIGSDLYRESAMVGFEIGSNFPLL